MHITDITGRYKCKKTKEVMAMFHATFRIGASDAVSPVMWSKGATGSEFPRMDKFCWDTFHSFSMFFLLVGGLEHFLFSHILGIIIPID